MTTLPHRKTYPIIPGHQHGRKLGFPTLNFEIGAAGIPIEPGIYAGFVTLAGKPAQASFYYGPRYGVPSDTLSFEAYLLDTNFVPIDILHATVWVEIFLRPVQQFSSIEALKKQITADVAATRRALRPWSENE